MMVADATAQVDALKREIDRRQAENRRLRVENRGLGREVKALARDVAALRAENALARTENVELQELLIEARGMVARQATVIEELERRLNQTSRNSSKPPSSDGPGAERPGRGSRKKDKRKRGGQAGHAGKGRELLPENQVTEFFDHRPTSCECCGNLLMGDDVAPERIQTIEIPPVVPVVEEHRIHSLKCLACGAVTTAEVPPELRASPFGPRLHSAVALLGGLFRLAKREIQAAMDILYDVRVGLGSVPKMEQRMKQALDGPYDAVLERVRGSPYANQDSTGWRENKKRAHLWVTATPELAHYHINRRANREVAKTLLGDDYGGVVVTDRAAAQAWEKQQWCWSHLARDFEAMSELHGGGWYGGRLAACAQRVHARYAEYACGQITHAEMVQCLAPVRQQVHRLLVNGADHAPSKRAARVCAHLLKGEHKLWTFLDHEGVPPTNNHAERCVRKAVLWRAVCFGSDSPAGSRYAERILTVVNSLRLQQRDREILDWLVTARLAQLNDRPAPSLVPASATP